MDTEKTIKRAFIVSFTGFAMMAFTGVAHAQGVAATFDFGFLIGGTSNEAATSVAVDGEGSTFVAGRFANTIDLDPDIVAVNSHSSVDGSVDVYLAKYDSTADFLDGLSFGSNGDDNVNSITVDNEGNVFLVGHFSGSCDFDPDGDGFTLEAHGKSDAFVACYTNSLNFQWAIQLGGKKEDVATYVAFNGNDGIWVTGTFEGKGDFDGGAAKFNLVSAGKRDVFVASYALNGELNNASHFGGPRHDDSNCLALDDAGNVYIAGAFSGTAEFDVQTKSLQVTSQGNSRDAFVVQYNSDGAVQWVATVRGTSQFEEAFSISCDDEDHVFVTGTFAGTADFDSSANTLNLVSQANSQDIFALKLNGDGETEWARRVGAASVDSGFSVSVDSSDDGALFTGMFTGTVDFNPGAATFNLSSSAGTNDTFILKLDAEGDFSWAQRVGGNAGADAGLQILASEDGISLVGSTRGNFDINPGPPVLNVIGLGAEDSVFIRLMIASFIEVTNPVANASLAVGAKVKVRWNSGGDIGENVKIELWRNNGFRAVLKASTPNDGVQRITIPSGFNAGANYFIRITDLDGNESGDSGRFRIVLK